MVADHDIGDPEWLRISVSGVRPSGVWTSPRQLLAVDSAGRTGEGLAELVTAIQRSHPDVEASLVWTMMHTAVTWPVIKLAADLATRARRIVRIRPHELSFELNLDGHEPGVRGVHLRHVDLVVQPDDPLADTPDVEVRSYDEMLRMMVADIVAFAAPFIEAVRAHSSIGRRGLWGGLVNMVADPFVHSLGANSPLEQRQRVDRLWTAVAGTPLDQRLHWIDFDHGGEAHTVLRTTSCCLAYKWPEQSDHRLRPDGCDPRWDRYCLSCPRIPTDETIHRARYWLDHPEG
jgi:hypothetical protein